MPLVRLSKVSCIASVLATACVGTRGNEGRASKATTVDTEIVFVASDKAAGDFPQVKDSSRILPGGSIQPDLAAPPCPSTTLPDTRTWPRLESPLPLAHFRSVSIRLPRGFKVRQIRKSSREDTEAVTRASEFAIADWEMARSGHEATFPPHIVMWTGSAHGYPTSRMIGVKRQVQFAECRLSTGNRSISVILFTVEWPERTDFPSYYLIAHWEPSPGVHARVLTSSTESILQMGFLAALHTVDFTPR